MGNHLEKIMEVMKRTLNGYKHLLVGLEGPFPSVKKKLEALFGRQRTWAPATPMEQV